MLALLLALSAARADTPADAPAWTPLAVALECESKGRIDACTLVQGMIDGSDLFLPVPRAQAQVRLYVTVTEEASDDLVLLRLVADDPRLPPSYELVQRVDSRLPVDEQRAALDPAFRRALAVPLAITNPAAVDVALTVPDGVAQAPVKSSPYGLSLYAGGWGYWTPSYQMGDLWTGGAADLLTDRARIEVAVGGGYSISREPSLDIEGHTVSLDTEQWSLRVEAFAERHLSDHWCYGVSTRGGREDPEGRYAWTGRAHAGVAWDAFPSDDPRGNVLSLTALAGAQADAYRATNELGQDGAVFPTAMLLASGEVRKDRTSVELTLSAAAQIPIERYVLEARGKTSVQLGDHVDLSFTLGVTQQAVPGPADLDTGSYEAVTRSKYAEPLNLDGSLDLRVYWENTNGARNNRFDAVDNLYALDSL